MNTRGRRILSMVKANIGNENDFDNSDQKYDLRAVTEETTRPLNYVSSEAETSPERRGHDDTWQPSMAKI